MNASTPAVSVFMRVYNAGRFLIPAIDRGLAQTLANFKLIAIGNAATGGWSALLRPRG